MSEKRKDNKGRILKDGESQRKNGTYMYRYTDIHKKRQYVYAKTLDALRMQEEAIKRDLADGIDYTAGEITVSELVDRYMGLKMGLKENTLRAYGSAVNRIKADGFGQRRVKTVKKSDAKSWFVQLCTDGIKRNTIQVIQSVIRPAFEMAVEDDMIRKNPFKFNLSEVLPDDAYVRPALSKPQQQAFLGFIRDYGRGNYYDDIVVLLGSGMRVSELYGLTVHDIDFSKRCIHIERQLCRTAERPYFVTQPKTKSGVRDIPMTDAVYMALKRVLQNRAAPKTEFEVDGYSGFLFLDKSGMPKVAMHLENYMRSMRKKYAALNGEKLPDITPHVLRHTFCTEMQRAGIDVKSLQYLMGHSTASVTLDVYTHTDYEVVERAFEKAAMNL